MAETKLSLKLLTDKKSKKVLFAEAGKDFVDFLFNLLSLPVSTVIRLFGSSNMVGSIGNLYSSVGKLNDTYIQANQNKDVLLKPQLPTSATGIPMLLPGTNQTPAERKLYICPYNHPCVTDKQNTNCANCNHAMTNEVKFISLPNATTGPGTEGGYVKGLVTYMVMDDLTVTPISMISGVAMMNKCNIQDFSALEEKVVEFGMEEGLALLKASMTTKAVLTSVFMTKEPPKGADVPD